MISEKQFEDIICKYPDIIEDNLAFQGRQIHVHGKIMDILFKDKFGQNLIVELKIGPIDRKHIGQVMEYEGNVLSIEDPTARVMLIGNRVPPNLKRALDHHGVEYKEISISQLKDFLKSKHDKKLLNLFNDLDKDTIETKGVKKNLSSEAYISQKSSSGVWIFQANPKWYRFIDKLNFGTDRETWRVMRFKKEIKKGDTVMFWVSGTTAGIYAIGAIDTDPMEIYNDKETAQFCTPQYAQAYPIVENICTRVWVKYTKKFIDSPISKEQLKTNDILKNLSILRHPQGTNFKVTKEEWEELKKILPMST